MSTQAAVLLHQWMAHANDDGAARDSVLAVWGHHTPLGHYATYYDKAPYREWLSERAKASGMADWPLQIKTRSPAALAMIEHQVSKVKGRRVAAPPDTYRALGEYYRERLSLLQAMAAYYDGGEDKPGQWHALRAHIRATARVIEKFNTFP